MHTKELVLVLVMVLGVNSKEKVLVLVMVMGVHSKEQVLEVVLGCAMARRCVPGCPGPADPPGLLGGE